MSHPVMFSPPSPTTRSVPGNSWTHTGSWGERALGVRLPRCTGQLQGRERQRGLWDYILKCEVYNRALPSRTINQQKKKKKKKIIVEYSNFESPFFLELEGACKLNVSRSLSIWMMNLRRRWPLYFTKPTREFKMARTRLACQGKPNTDCSRPMLVNIYQTNQNSALSESSESPMTSHS